MILRLSLCFTIFNHNNMISGCANLTNVCLLFKYRGNFSIMYFFIIWTRNWWLTIRSGYISTKNELSLPNIFCPLYFICLKCLFPYPIRRGYLRSLQDMYVHYERTIGYSHLEIRFALHLLQVLSGLIQNYVEDWEVATRDSWLHIILLELKIWTWMCSVCFFQTIILQACVITCIISAIYEKNLCLHNFCLIQLVQSVVRGDTLLLVLKSSLKKHLPLISVKAQMVL